MDIAREQAAAVDEAREEQRGADHRFLGVEVAAILAWRNRAHAFVLGCAVGAAESAGSASTGCGVNAAPPASASAFSRLSHLSISGLPGSTPTVPMNAFIGTAIPGRSFDRASSRFSSQ